MSRLAAYFARIGYAGDRTPTLATLGAIQQRHMASIAFENLAPYTGHDVLLDTDSIYAKLVHSRRGGYCYEQNNLLLDVLRALGFEAQGLGARVRLNVADDVVTPRTHMLLLVTIDGVRHIVDVGFGGQTPAGPLRLEPEVIQETPLERCRLRRDGENYTLQNRIGDEWRSLYVFDLQPQLLADYQLANWYVSHHPRSHFVTRLSAARAVPEGRHALAHDRYTWYGRDGEVAQRQLGSFAELLDTLEREFLLDARGVEGLEQRWLAV